MSVDLKAQFILDFRKETYGVDEEGRQRPDFAKISRGYRNAIEQLSEGLYSKDVHFILELIQNAEDNCYDTDSPELSFVLMSHDPTDTPGSEGCLCVFNNERGFEQNHIESICQIGESTKKSKIGYIGEKGIGFKSVFVVSDQPHIYSNGYHFKFKGNDPDIPLSYIVPYVLDKTPRVVQNNPATTAILLPLKPGQMQKIGSQIASIKPETLLFLSKLSRINIEFDATDKRLALIRELEGKHIAVLRGEGNLISSFSKRYFIQKTVFEVPKQLDEPKRENVQERQVVVALPLDSITQGRVFAFLPTEVDSGLPFIVNADFLLSANREAIQTDREWNQWTRDCLTEPVVEAIAMMVNQSALAYPFIPLTKDLRALKDFFAPLCEKVCSELSERKVVRTDDGKLARPDVTFTASKQIRSLFPLGDRPAYFQRFNLVEKAAEKYRPQLTAIGVRDFGIEDLWACLEDRKWLESRDAEWFAQLYQHLKVKKERKRASKTLLNIILLENGSLLAPGEAIQVFYSTDEDVYSQLFSNDGFALPKASFLNRKLQRRLFTEAELLEWAGKTFGFAKFSLDGYIQKELIGWMESKGDSLPLEKYLNIFQFIADRWGELEKNTRKLIRERFPVLLENDHIVRRNDLNNRQLSTPKGLVVERGWQNVLRDAVDQEHLAVLSERYLSLDSDTIDIEKALERLGASDCPDMHIKKYKWGRMDCRYGNREYQDTLYGGYLNGVLCSGLRESNNEGYQLETWVPPKWILDGKRIQENAISLIEYLKNNNTTWPPRNQRIRNEEQYKWTARVKWNYYNAYEEYVDSCLLYFLKKHAWIETNKGYKRPGEVFVKNETIEGLLGDSIPYLKMDLDEEFVKYLGIRTEITAVTIIDYLRELSKDAEVDLSLIVRLYEYLDFEGVECSNEFAKEPLIYVPTREGWFTSDEAIWEDGEAVLGDSYVWLSSDYQEKGLQRFFIESVGVKQQVAVEQYAQAWVRLKDKAIDRKAVESALSIIYPVIVKWLKSCNERPEWFSDFCDQVKVWTQTGSFEWPVNVFVRDSAPLARLFKDEIDFIWKPDHFTHADLAELYEALNVPFLSAAVVVRLDNHTEQLDEDADQVFSIVSRDLFCGMLRNTELERFEKLIQGGDLKRLVQIRQVMVDELSLLYAIDENGIEKRVDSQNVYLNVEKGLLYVRASADQEVIREELAEQLARFVWKDRGFREKIDTLEKILETTAQDKARKLKEKRDWGIPSDFRKTLDVWLMMDGEISKINPEPDSHEKEEPQFGEQRKSHTESERNTEQDKEWGAPIEDDLSVKKDAVFDAEKNPDAEANQDNSSLHTDPDVGDGNRTSLRKPEQDSGRDAGEKSRSHKIPTRSFLGARASGGSGSRKHGYRTRSRDLSHKIRQRNQSRMVSYVTSGGDKNDVEETARNLERKRLGDMAEQWVAEVEEAAGFIVKRMPENNPGYDLELINRETGDVAYVEVKAVDGQWGTTGVGITSRQHTFLGEKASQGWLYVVENIQDQSTRRIYRIQDPINHIGRYFFDHGWRSIAAAGEADIDRSIPTVSLVDQLKALTDEKGRIIIEFCEDNNLALPEVGYETLGDNEEVIEELELAWPDYQVGLYDVEVHLEHISGWKIFSLDIVCEDPNVLVSILRRESSDIL